MRTTNRALCLCVGTVLLTAVSTVWGLSNNGFETDYVYYTDWVSASNYNIRVRSELTGLIVGTDPFQQGGTQIWTTLTFAGTGTNDARLFGAGTTADLTDITIVELNSAGNATNTASLKAILGVGQVGPNLSECCIRYSRLRNALFVGVNTDLSSNPPAKAWEINLG